MSIPLPPLPEPSGRVRLLGGATEPVYTKEALRARDLEIVRVVLEAAAKTARLCECDGYELGGNMRRAWNEGTIAADNAIRNLEFKHHE